MHHYALLRRWEASPPTRATYALLRRWEASPPTRATYALLRRWERLWVGEPAREWRRLLHTCYLCANVGGHASQRDTCHLCTTYALLRRWEASPPTRATYALLRRWEASLLHLSFMYFCNAGIVFLNKLNIIFFDNLWAIYGNSRPKKIIRVHSCSFMYIRVFLFSTCARLCRFYKA